MRRGFLWWWCWWRWCWWCWWYWWWGRVLLVAAWGGGFRVVMCRLILEEHRSFLVPVVPGQSQASRGRAMGNTEKSGRWCESVLRGCRQEQEGGTRVVPVCAKNERGERSGGLKVACVVPHTSHVSSIARTETTGIHVAVHFSHARHLPSGSIHNPDLYTLLAPRNLFHSSSPYRRSDVEERGRCLLMSHRIYCS